MKTSTYCQMLLQKLLSICQNAQTITEKRSIECYESCLSLEYGNSTDQVRRSSLIKSAEGKVNQARP